MPIPLDNPEARKLIPVVTDKMFWCARQKTAIGFGWTILSVILLMIFLQSGLARKLSNFAENKSSALINQVFIFTGLWGLAVYIITLPISYFTDFVFSHHYGLSSQPFIGWMLDSLKAFTMGIAIEVPLWTLLLFLIRKYPKSWPQMQALASIPIMLFMTFISPILLAPVFNNFVLMKPSLLQSEIKNLATRAGIPNAPIYIVDKSKQTNTVNAYVTGIGLSHRIVIWDTTLKKLPQEQVLCVVAHELGHYALHHVLIAVGLGILFSLFTIPVNIYFTPLVYKYLPAKWGIKRIQDLSTIAIFFFVTNCGEFWLDPVMNSYSRIKEREADLYGLKLHRDPMNFARTYAFLATENLAEPCPPKLLEIWLYSHPPLATRIKYITEDAKSQTRI
ncbi:MAG: M48 family metallopeptidase [Candidatus Melainabacteria bacterium]|nr:M48 family metallopeptidase [Candidatus Melainabacteria bacterium]